MAGNYFYSPANMPRKLPGQRLVNGWRINWDNERQRKLSFLFYHWPVRRINYKGGLTSVIKVQFPKNGAKKPADGPKATKTGRVAPATAVHMLEKLTPFNREEDKPRGITDEVLKELDDLVGLQKIKKLVWEIRAFVDVQKKRSREKLATEPQVLHMVFKGNPGTGKTTVARIMGKLFKELGVLPKGHLVEVERADLVGEYIGHTAVKTRDHVKKALGGILFIDEAYALARGGDKDFGKETIDTLVKAMEDHKDNLILILAGYREEMDWFIRSNPGLRSRFPIHLDFPDYLIEELLSIAEIMLAKREYRMSSEARLELKRILLRQQSDGHEHGRPGDRDPAQRPPGPQPD